jgi:hypothetical protein
MIYRSAKGNQKRRLDGDLDRTLCQLVRRHEQDRSAGPAYSMLPRVPIALRGPG